MGVKKRQQKFGKVKNISYIYIINNKTNKTMDSRLTQLKEVKDKLRVEIQKEDTKVHLALENLHKEEQKEKQKVLLGWTESLFLKGR